jgi:outer membrane immunogenic protein
MGRLSLFFAVFAAASFFSGSPNRALADDLDTRIAELEKKNLELKKMLRIEALEKENSALSKRLTLAPAKVISRETVASFQTPRGDNRTVYEANARYNPTKAEQIAAPYHPSDEPLTPLHWAGAYWGASAGGAATRSSVTANEQYIGNYPTNSFPYNINGESMSDISGPGHRGGALIDAFGGWNFQVSRAIVVGAQVEATASDLNLNSAGTRTYNYFNGAGPTGQTAIEDFRPQVSSNWMASALLRAGFLADDKTLIYGIGGVTLAQFEARNLADNSFYQLEESFVASGWTAGAGIERKLGSNWSVRAEYRYTNFGSHSSNGQFNFQSSGSFAGTQTYQRQAQFDQSMQAGRIGIAYSIDALQ